MNMDNYFNNKLFWVIYYYFSYTIYVYVYFYTYVGIIIYYVKYRVGQEGLTIVKCL